MTPPDESEIVHGSTDSTHFSRPINARFTPRNERDLSPFVKDPRDRGSSSRSIAPKCGYDCTRQPMENEIPRSQTPHPAHSNGSEDDTRAALRELQLAVVDRDAQIARLEVQLQHACEDTERACAETAEAQVQLKEAQTQLAALRTKYERAKGWWAANHKRKNEDSGAREDSSPSRSPEQACPSALPNSSPDPSRRPIPPALPPLQSQAHVQALADRDPRKRIKLDATTSAPRPHTQASTSTPTPIVQAGRPLPDLLPLPSCPKTPPIPPPTQRPAAVNAHRAVVTPISILKPTLKPPQGPDLEARRPQDQNQAQTGAFQSGTFQVRCPNANAQQLQRPNPNASRNGWPRRS
ncbi:hypothetical protein FB451DRAFT_1167927 [Mycena latifolia]|nr:hypothetical protein FB451DRAFT_1167927 [Mycena latifolia]